MCILRSPEYFDGVRMEIKDFDNKCKTDCTHCLCAATTIYYCTANRLFEFKTKCLRCGYRYVAFGLASSSLFVIVNELTKHQSVS